MKDLVIQSIEHGSFGSATLIAREGPHGRWIRIEVTGFDRNEGVEFLKAKFGAPVAEPTRDPDQQVLDALALVPPRGRSPYSDEDYPLED